MKHGFEIWKEVDLLETRYFPSKADAIEAAKEVHRVNNMEIEFIYVDNDGNINEVCSDDSVSADYMNIINTFIDGNNLYEFWKMLKNDMNLSQAQRFSAYRMALLRCMRINFYGDI